jgi:hypothetical protein
VSEDSPSDAWEDWIPNLSGPDPGTERFKWGWNEAEGEAVWEVGGPGDGWPAHAAGLMTAWGREPDLRRGDVLGTAEHVAGRDFDPAVVSIQSYRAPVPDAIVAWFREAFPGAEIRLVGLE